MSTDEARAAAPGATGGSEPGSTPAFESAVRALPRTRILIAAGVVAAALVIVAGVDLIGGPAEPTRTEAALDVPPTALGELDSAADPEDDGGASRAAFVAREARRLDELEAALAALASELAQAQLEARSRETESKATLAGHAARLDEVEGSIRALFERATTIDERLDVLVRRVDDLAAAIESVRAAPKKARVARAPRRSGAPPFTVDAIDQWDGVAYAVVLQGGEPAFLRVGEVRSGWRLAAIDTTARSVELVDTQGRGHVHRLVGQ